jgi:hypothetical protein
MYLVSKTCIPIAGSSNNNQALNACAIQTTLSCVTSMDAPHQKLLRLTSLVLISDRQTWGRGAGYVKEKKVMITYSTEGTLLMKERHMIKGPTAKYLINYWRNRRMNFIKKEWQRKWRFWIVFRYLGFWVQTMYLAVSSVQVHNARNIPWDNPGPGYVDSNVAYSALNTTTTLHGTFGCINVSRWLEIVIRVDTLNRHGNNLHVR